MGERCRISASQLSAAIKSQDYFPPYLKVRKTKKWFSATAKKI